MKLYKSIRAKFLFLAVCFVFPLGLFSVMAAFEVQRVVRIADERMVQNANIAVAVTHVLFLSHQARVALKEIILVFHEEQYGEIEKQEAIFHEAVADFELFLKALTWGTESEAFEKSEGGLTHDRWVQKGWREEIVLSHVPPEIQQLTGATGIYFSGFAKHAKEAIRNAKEAARLASAGLEAETREGEEAIHRSMEQAYSYDVYIGQNLEKIMKMMDHSAEASSAEMRSFLTARLWHLTLIGLAFFALAVVVNRALANRFLVNPLIKLAKDVRKIGEGDLNAKVFVTTLDEIGHLAISVNQMTEDLKRVTVSRDALSSEMMARQKAEEALRKNQDLLFQSQKMEAIGKLTGGIAHDFNNLLGIITGYCELSLSGLKGDDPLQDNLREIQRAGERAANLTRQLLAFGRRQILQPKVLDLSDVLGRMGRMLQRLIGEDIGLVTVLDPELGQVKADPGQMDQVIMNLALNARDAMLGGGKLTLETKNVVLDQEYAVRHSEVRPGPYVMMAVSDTGKGMDAKTMEHIFEPFFTTKGKGKGTGLGLSTVYGIVKQSGGHISVYSEPGHGTSFKVYLPRLDDGVESSVSPNTPVTSLRGSETVLVVEDEERLRKLVCRILGEKGYAVLEASSGDEALRVSESHEGTIALLVTDVIMPGISGRETADRLTLKRPKIKVLYMSGYTDNAIVHHGVLEEGTHFLPKPFTPEVLARKVREVLESGSTD